MQRVKMFLSVLIFLNLACDIDKVYRKPIERPIQTLNPKTIRERSDYMIARNIYGQFVAYDVYGNIRPGVFKDWSIGDAGRVYTFTLNLDVKFHDGKNITMDDVVFSLNYLASNDSLVSRNFANVEGYDVFIRGENSRLTGIKAIGTDKLEICLKSRSYVFLSQLADPKMVLLPAHLRGKSEEDFFTCPIGAGAYRVKRFNSDHSRLVLERFEGFYDKKSNIMTYELEAMDKARAISLFVKGELEDLEVYSLDKEEIDSLHDFANFFSPSPFSVNLLFFNGRKSYLQDLGVRKMIAEAIDTAVLSSKDSTQLIPTNSIIPHGLLGWSCGYSLPNTKEQTRAKSLLKNKKRQIRILSYNDKLGNGVLDYISKSIEEKTGFSVIVDLRTYSDVLKIFVNGEYDLLLEGISIKVPEPFHFFAFFDPKSTHDLIFFKDTHISRLLAESEGLLGVQRSNKYLELSHYIVHEKFYAIPLYTQVYVYAFNKKVKAEGSPATLLGTSFFEQVQM